MRLSERYGHHEVQALTDRLCGSVTEEGLRTLVPASYHPVDVDLDYGMLHSEFSLGSTSAFVNKVAVAMLTSAFSAGLSSIET
jgi:hypothetical protein